MENYLFRVRFEISHDTNIYAQYRHCRYDHDDTVIIDMMSQNG